MPTPVDNAPKVVCEPKVWTDAPIIEEYESDSDDDSVSNVQENKEKPSFACTDSVKHDKPSKENVKETCTPNHSPKIKKQDRNSHTRKGLCYAFTKKACFVCDSFSHLIKDCDFHEKRMAKQAALTKSKNKVTGQRENRPVWNNVQRVNHQNNAVKENEDTAVKASVDDPNRALKDKGIFNSGCSRYMIRNKAHLADYQEFKGSSVVKNKREKDKIRTKPDQIKKKREAAFNDDEPLYPDDHSMPHFEDIYANLSEGIFTDSSYDNEGVVIDFNNLETTVYASPSPTSRIHTIHPKTQILRDPMLAVQTRSKVNKNSKARALKSWCDEFEDLMKNRFQMSSMGELTVKQKEDDIFISQDKYVAEILKSFDFLSVTASTPIKTQKPLVKDKEAVDVDRIFRYLKGQPKLGLWYPKVSSFDLEAYSDSDYAGANLDRKSITEGLFSWLLTLDALSIATLVEGRLLE
nr:hypothetical protein [Tanacetum cinerariifolium]